MYILSETDDVAQLQSTCVCSLLHECCHSEMAPLKWNTLEQNI